MDPKLTILFMLIGSIIVLSNLTDGTFRRIRRQLATRNLRRLMPGLRRV
jgi:hypothetical protein